MDAVVIGNVTVDVICQTVNEVPRYDSITFEKSVISPGGCGSNVAIGLCALGVSTGLVARIGGDASLEIITPIWRQVGLDERFVRRMEHLNTGVSIGLVDEEAQPRFIHTSGANATLTAQDIDIQALLEQGMRYLHVAGYFVLPGLMNGGMAEILALAQRHAVHTSLDVVRSPRMKDPTPLWSCLPLLDVFLCNAHEGARITGRNEPVEIGCFIRDKGARACIVKLGQAGCWLESRDFSGQIEGERVLVMDTTGAGDAFAAGLLAGLIRGEALSQACTSGNRAGARIVARLGAISGWLPASGA